MSNQPFRQELTLESNTFCVLKSDFNEMLQNVLKNMKEKEKNQAELNLKLNITFEKELVQLVAEDGTKEQMEVIKPMFEHKISSILKIKEEQSGSLSGDYELVYDEDMEEFVMRKMNYGQVTIFDENN